MILSIFKVKLFNKIINITITVLVYFYNLQWIILNCFTYYNNCKLLNLAYKYKNIKNLQNVY